MEDKLQQDNPISPYQSHYFQAIYDHEGHEAATELDTPFNQIDFERLKSFCLYPLVGSPLQTAIVIDYTPGFRLIYRKEGVLNLGTDPNRPGRLVPQQGAYTYILGLVEDDGSDSLRLIEKGEICSLKAVDFRGGFRIILTPDGKLNAVGSYEVEQEEREVAGVMVQFIHFHIKLDV